ncbi:titin-like isoform X2 [Raphanus sativus]|uniref:Uncharacterized protein LOC108815835 isoform X2 n=1 Tax=Raphanus sativus TaxID=3726 RepID=A0A6J0K8F2_RAPSA|nr:uncharacterized protein LOC108815835 isoform X2 [Raphanus sativus]KAJ4885364.1 titin-like isoform X2 [Raphanus sativus]
MDTGVVITQEPVFTKTSVQEAHAGVVLEHSTMDVDKVNLSTVLDNSRTSTIEGKPEVAEVLNGPGNKETEESKHEKEEVVEDSKMVKEKERETETDEQGTVFVNQPKNTDDAKVILFDVKLEKEKEDETTQKPEEVSVETETKNSQEQEKDISKAIEEIPIKTDEVEEEKDSRTVETSVNGTEAEHNETVSVETFTRNSENIVKETAPKQETTTHVVETTERVLVEAEKDETETVNTVVKDPEIVSNEETAVHDLKENEEAVEAIKNSDDAEQVSREVSGDKEKEEDIIHKEAEVQESPTVIETPTIKEEDTESKASKETEEHEHVLVRDIPQDENLKPKAETVDTSTVQESAILKTMETKSEMPQQGEAESLVTKEVREQEDTENFEVPIDLALKVDREELMDEKKEADQVAGAQSIERGLALNESEAEETPVIQHSDVVESGEQMEKPSLESPSKLSEETRKTLEEKIQEKAEEEEEEEEVSPHQEGQEEGSYGSEKVPVPESIESCLPVEKDEEVKSDEFIQVSSASPEGEKLVEAKKIEVIKANEEEEQLAADKTQSILDTEPVKSNEETTVHESIVSHEVTGDREKEEDIIIHKAQEVPESLTIVETPTIQGEDIELKASEDTEEHEHVLVRDIPQEETLVPKAETVNTSTVHVSGEPSLDLKEQEETVKTVTSSDEVQQSITLMEPPKLSPEQISKDTEEDEHVLERSMPQGEIFVTEAESLVTKESKETVMDLKEQEKTEKLEEVPSDLALEVDKEEVMEEKKEAVDDVAGDQTTERGLELNESEADLVEKQSIESPSEETSKTLGEKIQEKPEEEEEEVAPHQEGQEEGSYILETKEEGQERVSVPESSEVEEKSQEERSLDLTLLQEESCLPLEQNEEEIKEQIHKHEQENEEVKSDEVTQVSSGSPEGESVVEAKKKEEIKANEEEQVVKTETVNTVEKDPEIVSNEETTVHDLKENEEAVEAIKNSDDAEQVSREVTGDKEKEEDIIHKEAEVQESPTVIQTPTIQGKDIEPKTSKETEEHEHVLVRDIPQDETLVPKAETVDTSTVQESEILKTLETKSDETDAEPSLELKEKEETVTPSDEVLVELPKPSPDQRSIDTEENEHVLGSKMPQQGEAESLVTKEEVAPHQEGQKEGSYGSETVPVPESIEQEELCLPVEKDEEVKSDDVIQVSSASPEGETLVEAKKIEVIKSNEEEEQLVADKIQSILEIVDTEPVKSNEETTVHESIVSHEEIGDREKEEDIIIHKAQEVQESLAIVETPTIEDEDIELKASKDNEEHEHVLVRDIPQEETLVPKAETVNTSTVHVSGEPSLDLKEQEETVKTVTSSDEVQQSITLMEPPKQISKDTEEDEHVLERSIPQGEIFVTEAESLVTKENKETVMDLKEQEKTEKLEEVPSDLALEVDKEEVMDEKKEADDVAGDQNMERGLELNESEAKLVEKQSIESPSEETSKTLGEKIQEVQEEGSYELKEKSQEERSLDLTPLQEESCLPLEQSEEEIKEQIHKHEQENEEVKSDEVTQVSYASPVKSNEDDIAESLSSAGEEIQTERKDGDNVQKDETAETSVNGTEDEHKATVLEEGISKNDESIVPENTSEEIKNSDEAEEKLHKVTGDREKEEDIMTWKTTKEMHEENTTMEHENLLVRDVPQIVTFVTEAEDVNTSTVHKFESNEAEVGQVKQETETVISSDEVRPSEQVDDFETEEYVEVKHKEPLQKLKLRHVTEAETEVRDTQQGETIDEPESVDTSTVQEAAVLNTLEIKINESEAVHSAIVGEEEERQVPSLESPSEETSKTADEKIEEEVTLQQQSEETVTVPESSELGVQAKEEEEESCPPKNETKEKMSEEDSSTSAVEEKSDQVSSAPLSEEPEAEKIEDLKENEEEQVAEAVEPHSSPPEESNTVAEKVKETEPMGDTGTGSSSKLVEEEKLKQDKEILEVPSSETIPQETLYDDVTETHEEEAQTRDIEPFVSDKHQEEEQANEESPRKKVISAEEGEIQTREPEEENMVDSSEKNNNETLIAETKKEDEDETVGLDDASKTSENECSKQEEFENLETPKVEDKSQEVSETMEEIETTGGDQSPSFITELEDQIPKQIKEIHEEEIKEAQAVVDQTSSLISEQVEEIHEEETKESHKVEDLSGQNLPVEASQTLSSELDDKTAKQVEEETKAHKLQEEEEEEEETKPKESDDQIETSTDVTKVEDEEEDTKETDTQVAEIMKAQELKGTLQPGAAMEDQDPENSSDDFTFSKPIGDENSSTLPVVGILKELQTTLEESERGNYLNSINAEPETLEKSLVLEETPASEIIEANMLQDSISRELEFNVEETPADLSLTEVLPGEKILIPSNQEEGKKQEDLNASTSEKTSLQEEEHPGDFEISNKEHNAETQETVKEEDQTFDNKEEKKNEELQDEKLSTLYATRETDETSSPEVNNNNNNQEDASELGVNHDSATTPQVEEEQEAQSVLGNDQEVLTSEKKITEPLSVGEKELTEQHVQAQAVSDDTKSSNEMDFNSEQIPKDQREEAGETADSLITSEKVQLQDLSKGFGQEKQQSTDLAYVQEDLDGEIKDEGHDSVLAHKKDSDLIEEKKEVDYVKTEPEDAIKHGVSTQEKNICEKTGLEATKEIYQEECKKTDTATGVKEEIKEEEKETTEDSLNSMKNADDETKDYGLDSVVAQKKESGSIEEKKEVDYVKTELEDAVKHGVCTEEEATKEIYEEESKQTNTVTAIKEEMKEEKKDTPEDFLNSMKNTDDATEKSKPEIQEIDKLSPASETPQKQGDEVPTQQKREIADDVPKIENLEIAEKVQQKYGEDETEPTVKEPARKSLSDLIQNVKVTDKPEVATTEPRMEEEATAEGEDEDGEEHKDDKTSPDSIVMVEAKDTVSIIKTQKKSHGILSGVGSKVKHSISKVKKALTGKSSHPTKPSSPQ